MHASLAVTIEGLPLGLAAIKFWSRQQFKGNRRAEAQDQPDAGANRAQGEHPLAGEYAPVYGAARRACTLRARRRPRE
jgi:hypothetical protein